MGQGQNGHRRVIGLGAFTDNDILTGRAFKERRKR